jgi:hypothetical protein
VGVKIITSKDSRARAAWFYTERRMYFEILGPLRKVHTIAITGSAAELARLRLHYGRDRWRKRKGLAAIRLAGGVVVEGEIHWQEAAGIGKRELKIKRLVG